VSKMPSTRKITAICGKGGAGKTAISAMLATAIARLHPSFRTLLIDADPAGGLTFAIGAEPRRSIGQVREEVIRQARSKENAVREKLADSIDYYVMEALAEMGSWSLLTMGRGESPGCFCPVNSLLREAIEAVSENFDRIIIDGEAGIEQITRKVMRSVDVLLVVSDTSARGLNTARLITEMVNDGDLLDTPEIMLVLNRVAGADGVDWRDVQETSGLKPVAVIPEDDVLKEWDSVSRPLSELPDDSPAMAAVTGLARGLFPAENGKLKGRVK